VVSYHICQAKKTGFGKDEVIMPAIMPRKSKLKLPPLNLVDETLGQRLARLRKERGYTQAELADKMGIIRELVSDYERGKIRPHYEMVIRFALALEVTSDELLGIKPAKTNTNKPSLKILRRMKKIETLPFQRQNNILKAIDMLVKGAEK
jgi:transcriptional regulator with XRE-family HTH domain